MVVVALLGTLVLSGRLVATPPLIAIAALLPSIGWAGLVLLLDRRMREPWAPLGAAFLWGAAAAAPLASEVNDALLATNGLNALVPTLLGPAVEEVAKASALLVVLAVWHGVIDDPLDGMVYGALAGLGFAATENLGYYVLAALQDGPPGLMRALWLRGFLQGLNHAAFTAAVGAAVGWAHGARLGTRAAVVSVGFALAVLVHAMWNTVAAAAITQVLCGAPAPGAPCTPAPAPLALLVTVPVLVATFVGPLGLLLFAIAARARRSPSAS